MRKGFTLMELLIVLGILGILVGALIVRAVNLSPEAKNKRAYNDLRNIKLAVEAYVAETGVLPTTSNNSSDLENALTNAKTRLIDYIPNDPWNPGSKYGWKRTSDPDKYYVIYSVGANASSNISVSSADQGTVSGGDADDIWNSNCKNNNNQVP